MSPAVQLRAWVVTWPRADRSSEPLRTTAAGPEQCYLHRLADADKSQGRPWTRETLLQGGAGAGGHNADLPHRGLGGTSTSYQPGRVLKTISPRARDDIHKARGPVGTAWRPELHGLPTNIPGRPSVFGRKMSQNHCWLLLVPRYLPILTLRGDLARGNADEQVLV